MPSAVLLLLLFPALCAAADLRGTVADVRGGERLARVSVRLAGAESVTNERGEFAFTGIAAGEYELVVSTVGYRLFRQKLALRDAQPLELEIALSPEAFTQRESVEVKAGAFEPIEITAPTERTLAQSEVKNLGSVLADDPLRAMHSLPGVSANDDFESRFAIRGADFRNIGIFLDGILLHAPFHTVHTSAATGSLTILNGDQVESLSLLAGGFSARYGDRTAAAVVVHSREGGRLQPSARLTASASNAGLLAEGPLGRRGGGARGSWMAAVRKSYLDYIIRRTSADASIAFGFLDGQARAVYDLNSQWQLSVQAAAGDSALDRSHIRSRLGRNSVLDGVSRVTMAGLGLRYVAGPRLLVTTGVSGLRETFRDRNIEGAPLGSGQYGEATAHAEVTLYLAAGAPLEFGASARRAEDETVRAQSPATGRLVEFERLRGNGWITGGFVQQSGSWKRLRASAGLRWDAFLPTGEVTAGPRAALRVALPAAQALDFGWGQYSQFPEPRMLAAAARTRDLVAERSTHFVAGWEWQAWERARVRVEFYDREDRNGLDRPFADPRRLASGAIYRPALSTPFDNVLKGHSRGIEMFVQRRSANRLTGWVSYAYGRSEWRDVRTGLEFPSDNDQRHTINLYAGYRLRPSVNLSGRLLAGSGFPVPGFFQRTATGYELSRERNRVRLDWYERVDWRINKTVQAGRRRITIYGEVVNLLNRRNLRFSELGGYNAQSGQASVRFDRLFPIIPSAGLVLEF